MSEVLKKKNNFFERFKVGKKTQYVIVATIIAVITIIFAVNFISKDQNSENQNYAESYVYSLESRLAGTLSKVKGVGKVSVLIQVDGGMETLLATKTVKTESGGKTQTEESPILVNGKTVVLKEIYPEIIGVIIVAEGADNITVMRKIQDATVSFLNVSLDKIEILSMK